MKQKNLIYFFLIVFHFFFLKLLQYIYFLIWITIFRLFFYFKFIFFGGLYAVWYWHWYLVHSESYNCFKGYRSKSKIGGSHEIMSPVPLIHCVLKVASSHAKIDESFANYFLKTKVKNKCFKILQWTCLGLHKSICDL